MRPPQSVIAITAILGAALIPATSQAAPKVVNGCTITQNTKCRDAVMHHRDLHGAVLHHADLRRADLRHADLHGADLRYADLHGADLRHADLSGAKLKGAKFAPIARKAARGDKASNQSCAPNCQSATPYYANLTGANLTSVTWEDTTCPNGSFTNTGC